MLVDLVMFFYENKINEMNEMRLKARVGRLKARVRRLKARVWR